MKVKFLLLAVVMISASAVKVTAVTRYVDLTSPSPTPPYTSWPTAATNIQDAIDAAVEGDLVLVTNGIYATGGKVKAGDLTNRIAIDKAITVQSVNGWAVTTIEGQHDFSNTNASYAVRCVWMSDGAVLSGFTVRSGQTRSTGDSTTLRNGGGVWCESTSSVITNSFIRDCVASSSGGGVFRGTFWNSIVFGNEAAGGGGVASSIGINSAIIQNLANAGGGCAQSSLTNCTVTKNSGLLNGGGANVGTAHNSIVWDNYSGNGSNYIGTTFSYSCTAPTAAGTGNISTNPQILPDGIHISATSPCRSNASGATVSGVDSDNQPWNSPPAMGCDEWKDEAAVMSPRLTVNAKGELQFQAVVSGQESISYSWLKDGTPIFDDSRRTGVTTSSLKISSIVANDAGLYQTVVSNAFGVATGQVAQVVIRLVSPTSITPMKPHTNWLHAASTIQDAIDTSSSGDVILVTNGVYSVGGKVMSGDLTNRIALDRPVSVLSVNGSAETVIEGLKDPATNGPSAIRSAWLSRSTALIGFTLRDGATRATGDQYFLRSGGGVWASGTNSLISNCVLVENAAHFGGGAYRGWLENCVIKNNLAEGDGGGCYSNVLNRCFVTENTGRINGGGMFGGTAYNSALTLNSASVGNGGGAYGAGNLVNCTVTYNRGSSIGGTFSTGSGLLLTNCIIWANLPQNYSGSPNIRNCCTTPAPGSPGNITADPLLLSDGIHISSNSPCRGVGLSVATGTDFDGQSWNSPPAMGCDEWKPEPFVTAAKFNFETWGKVRLSAVTTGQTPLTYQWVKDGALLSDDAKLSGANSQNLTVNAINPSDAGEYQLIASNSLGIATGQVTRLTIRFVDQNGTGASAPYTNWNTAATNIQDAVDVAGFGDLIFAANGIYGRGGKVMASDLTNRVALNKPIALMSANGPTATIIQGDWDIGTTNGPGSVRCVWMADNSSLIGFTIRSGATRASVSETTGGGIWCNSTNARIVNCIIQGNAAVSGGGVFCGTLINSLVKGNVANSNGGGTAHSSLFNCTVTENMVQVGLGSGVLNSGGTNLNLNTIIWGNYSIGVPGITEYFGAVFTNCCTRLIPAGTGNISTDPLLQTDGFHLETGSPCISAGNSNFVFGFDLDGQPWSSPPAMGCDQPLPQSAVGQPAIIPTGDGKVRLRTSPIGAAPEDFWWFKDGFQITNNLRVSGANTAELSIKSFAPTDVGFYHAIATNSFGSTTSTVVQLRPHFVDAASATPLPPFTNWTTAALTIQDAIDAADFGDLIVVADGIYSTGGKAVVGDLTNRIVLSKAVIVTSLNGPTNAIIEGQKDNTGLNGNGNASVRAAWMESWTSLNGFTIRNGSTRAAGDSVQLRSGGGTWGLGGNAVVRGSLITNNSANVNGGGSFRTTIENSTVISCLASNGGGLASGQAINSILTKNRAFPASPVTGSGGGASSSTLLNSLIHSNIGGGTLGCKIYNCTVTENQGRGLGGFDFAYNSIMWGNTVSDYGPSMSFHFCCTKSDPALFGIAGTNVVFADPQLVDPFHLSVNSPCRGTGGPLFVTGTDYDGDTWLSPVSMGADEFTSGSLTGALTVAIETPTNSVLPNRSLALVGRVTGRASHIEWSFGDGPVVTNVSYLTSHAWTSPGDYTVTFRAYNDSNLGGVSTTMTVHVLPIESPSWVSILKTNNNYQFNFSTQVGVTNVIEYATNLTAPVNWMPLKTSVATNLQMSASDTNPTNATRFYRLRAQ